MSGFVVATASSDEVRRVLSDVTLMGTLSTRLHGPDSVAACAWSGDVMVCRMGPAGSAEGHGGDVESLCDALSIESAAQVRSTGRAVEIVNSIVPWRTVWFARSDDLVLATTSLRAAAYLLGSFDPDDQSVGSMLATGTLGPSRSWDRRVHQLPPGSTLSFGSGGHAVITESEAPHSAGVVVRSDREASRALEAVLRDEVPRRLGLPAGWVVPLSGGVDSRALVLLGGSKLPTITWGARSSLGDKWSDASIATRLAAELELEHSFLDLEQQQADPGVVLEEFVSASDGRVDHIDGYVDGMQMWRQMADSGVRGIVRGDEAFGWVERRSETGVRRSVGALTAADIANSALATAVLELGGLWQSTRHADETLAAYRDRIYRAFRVPSVLAPLNETKSRFVGVTCPLLDDRIVTLAATLSDAQRTDKRLFHELVRKLSPSVPFARRSSLSAVRFAEQDPARRYLAELLDSGGAGIVPELIRERLVSVAQPQSSAGAATRSIRRFAGSAMPRALVTRIARQETEGPQTLSVDRCRLRAAIAVSAHSMLIEDARAGVDAIRSALSQGPG